MTTTTSELQLTTLQNDLIRYLADGNFHSGQQLGDAVGVSRSAVWKALQGLEPLGLDIQAVSGRGYRLAGRLELLARDAVLAELSRHSRALLNELMLFSLLDSTNAHLMRYSSEGHGHACLAEFQSAGRGRRGRQWISPFGSNIYISLRWRFDEGMAALSGLSLAAAVAVLHALRDVGIDDAGVKWPNDIYWQGRKLAGILLEVAGESAGPCHVVIGLGVNVSMPATAAEHIDQPWVDIRSIHEGVSRNRLAGRLLHHMLLGVAEFQQWGLAPFVDEWCRADILSGQALRLLLPNEERCGVGRGIDPQGALLLEVDGALQRYTYGEVSLRLLETSA